jgi:activator of HSP90 ATPase
MKTFKRYFIIKAPPDQVYLALTTEATFQLWSGDKAELIAEPNAEFSLWDGSIVGKMVSLEPGKKIVQQWYFGDQPEASIVTMKLHDHPKGTSLEIEHINIPDLDYDDIIDGWVNVYIKSLQEFYDED